MAKLKYMGSSHVHTLEKGDDFSGRLSEGIPKTVVFDQSNNWVVDSEESGLSEEAIKILTDVGDLKDVSDLKTIPANEHQKIFLGMKSGEANEDAGDEPRGQNLPEGDEPAVGSGSSEVDDDDATTAGGSTRTSPRGRRT